MDTRQIRNALLALPGFGSLTGHKRIISHPLITLMQDMGRKAMNSGDDSPYHNVWEEFATQIQGEKSVFWDVYESEVQRFCWNIVEEFSVTERDFLWLFTEQGEEWTWDVD